jgi:hypothetical protein
MKTTSNTNPRAPHERGTFRNKEGRIELALADYAAYRE